MRTILKAPRRRDGSLSGTAKGTPRQRWSDGPSAEDFFRFLGSEQQRTDFQVLSSILGHEQTQKGKHRATAFQDLHQGRADGTVSGTGGQHSASYNLNLGSVDQKSDVRAGPVPDKVVAVPHSPS